MHFDFTDTGTGPALLFLPGSYSSHAAWRGVHKALSGTYRLISTSLPGYGGTPEIRRPDVCDMDEMTDFVARVVTRIDAPVHLIGHSFGGLVCFATALSGKVDPLSLITFEGNPIYAGDATDSFAWRADTDRTNQQFEAACAADDPDAAAIIIDYWGQKGGFAAMPPAFQDYCRSTVHANVLDWRAAAGFTPAFAEFANLPAHSTIARGECANPAIKDISDRIVAQRQGGRLEVVAGAGHFLISTHPADCATIIDDHMARYAGTHG